MTMAINRKPTEVSLELISKLTTTHLPSGSNANKYKLKQEKLTIEKELFLDLKKKRKKGKSKYMRCCSQIDTITTADVYN